MTDLLLYEGKVAAALLVFYLFYRFLLKKETFHRLNRVVLVGTVVLAFVLPFIYLVFHFYTYLKMVRINRGRELNVCLGETARNILIYGLCVVIGLLMDSLLYLKL